MGTVSQKDLQALPEKWYKTSTVKILSHDFFEAFKLLQNYFLTDFLLPFLPRGNFSSRRKNIENGVNFRNFELRFFFAYPVIAPLRLSNA